MKHQECITPAGLRISFTLHGIRRDENEKKKREREREKENGGVGLNASARKRKPTRLILIYVYVYAYCSRAVKLRRTSSPSRIDHSLRVTLCVTASIELTELSLSLFFYFLLFLRTPCRESFIVQVKIIFLFFLLSFFLKKEKRELKVGFF